MSPRVTCEWWRPVSDGTAASGPAAGSAAGGGRGTDKTIHQRHHVQHQLQNQHSIFTSQYRSTATFMSVTSLGRNLINSKKLEFYKTPKTRHFTISINFKFYNLHKVKMLQTLTDLYDSITREPIKYLNPMLYACYVVCVLLLSKHGRRPSSDIPVT